MRVIFLWQVCAPNSVVVYFIPFRVYRAQFVVVHEMVLLQHEKENYRTKHVWCLCELQNKIFAVQLCGEMAMGKGVGEKQLL